LRVWLQFDHSLSRFPTIFKLDRGLTDFLDARRVLVIELVELRKCVLDFPVSAGSLMATAQRDGSLQFDLGHGCVIAMIHGGEAMQFFEAHNTISARQVRQPRLELLGTHSCVRWIRLDSVDRYSEVLEFSRRADIAIELARSAVEGRRGEKDIPLRLGQSLLDGLLRDQAGALCSLHTAAPLWATIFC
jgi:hypothetical protein